MILRFKVAMLSQPFEFVSVTLYEPAALYDCPFQTYGSALLQMVMLVVLVVALLIVRFKVAILSHPLCAVVVYVYVPDAFNVCPFQLYGNCVLQTLTFVLLVLIALITTTNVAIESQPFEPVNVAV